MLLPQQVQEIPVRARRVPQARALLGRNWSDSNHAQHNQQLFVPNNLCAAISLTVTNPP
jgi:hypothetical protein